MPKRAGAAAVTNMEINGLSSGNAGFARDLGRRFGPNQAFGDRFNGGYQDGDTALRDNRHQQGSANLALDWQLPRVHLYANLAYQHERDGASVFAPFILAPGLAVPHAPDAGGSAASP